MSDTKTGDERDPLKPNVWAEIAYEECGHRTDLVHLPALQHSAWVVGAGAACVLWPSSQAGPGEEMRQTPDLLRAAVAAPTLAEIPRDELYAALTRHEDGTCYFFGQPYQRRLILDAIEYQISEAPKVYRFPEASKVEPCDPAEQVAPL